MELMRQFDWPGNVRQLFDVADAANVMAPGDTIPREIVSDILADLPTGADTCEPGAAFVIAVKLAGSHSAAAKRYGVSTKTIQRKLRASGVPGGAGRPRTDGRQLNG
jgi:transcriptional regulator of acetoin/glycerol metabolism